MHLSPARVQRLSEEDKGKLRQVVRTHCRQRHFRDISDGAAVGRSLWRAKGRTIVWEVVLTFGEVVLTFGQSVSSTREAAESFPFS